MTDSLATPVAIPGRYASIDIGTVTSRMLVADVDAQGALTELTREYAITNLGEGVDATKRLKPEAIERVSSAVARFLDVLHTLCARDNVDAHIVAATTSAARDAENSHELVEAFDRLGVKLQVIPGQREAALSFAGASSSFAAGEKIVLVDVGGGSTEIIAGVAGCEPVRSHSFNIGCRRGTERFLHSDPPSARELADLRAWMRDQFAPYLRELAEQGFAGDNSRMVGVAGTATTVVSVRDAMEVYDTTRVHLACVSREELDSVFERMANVKTEQRRTIVGLDPDRAPVVVAGLAVLQEVMEAGGYASFTVSETDILHGLVVEASRA